MLKTVSVLGMIVPQSLAYFFVDSLVAVVVKGKQEVFKALHDARATLQVLAWVVLYLHVLRV